MKKIVVAFLLVIFVLHISNANAEVIKWDCKYPIFTSIEGIQKHSKTYAFTINLDTIDGKAFLEGNLGLSELVIHAGTDSISFMEKLGSGAVQTTTINVGTGESIHSRNTILRDHKNNKKVFVASQNFGNCKRLR